jgi:hypothetical protein
MSGLDVWLLGRPAGNTTDGYTVAQQLVTNVNPNPSGTQYYSITFTCNSAIGNAYLRFDNNGSTNGNNAVLFWNEVKIETGSTATPWCPAASEIANYSQIQQLSDNINFRVQKNDVINQINVSSESILIAGNKVHITGSTTIDNAVIKSAMIDSISADKITAGTLNAAEVNVINLNASDITSGTLSGTNLSLNLGTGEVLFQKGSIKSSNGTLDLEIDSGTLSVLDSNNNGFVLDNGEMTFYNYWSTSSSKQFGKLRVDNWSSGGLALAGNKGLSLSTSLTDSWGISASGIQMLTGDNYYITSYRAQTHNIMGLNNNPADKITAIADYIDLSASDFYLGDGTIHISRESYLSGDTYYLELVSPNDIYLNTAKINKKADTWYSGSTDWWFRQSDGNVATIHVQSVSQSSLLSLKTNLNKLEPAQALSTLIGTDIYSYNYKSDLKNGISKTYATAVIDDVNDKPQYNIPYDFISADGTGRDDGTILGYAVAAIKELNSKISSLETEIKQLKGAA